MSTSFGSLTGSLSPIAIAGAAGKDIEDILASDVTLVTLLVDASSSIHDRGLEAAVRDGLTVPSDLVKLLASNQVRRLG